MFCRKWTCSQNDTCDKLSLCGGQVVSHTFDLSPNVQPAWEGCGEVERCSADTDTLCFTSFLSLPARVTFACYDIGAVILLPTSPTKSSTES